MQQFHYKTLRHGRGPFAGVDVLGWGAYPSGSMAGQTSKNFINNYPDEAAARAAHPDVQGFSNEWSEPVNTFNHLPGEDDPVAGGMWPDDIDGGSE